MAPGEVFGLKNGEPVMAGGIVILLHHFVMYEKPEAVCCY